jgi:hypothetical protein
MQSILYKYKNTAQLNAKQQINFKSADTSAKRPITGTQT